MTTAPGAASGTRAGARTVTETGADADAGGSVELAAERASRSLRVVHLPGPVPYREALELQRRLARERIEDRRSDVAGREDGRREGRDRDDLLLLLEHEPVLTLGRTSGEGHLRVSRDRLEALGVETVEIERGGDVTYHGPGQLVGYPILDLGAEPFRKDLHWYVRRLEEVLIRALAELGLPAFRVPDHTGVWVGEGAPSPASGADAAIAAGKLRKIASIGVHVSRWVTWHGFALNVTDEPLERFRLIVPCGIEGVRMTSLASEGVEPGEGAMERARDAVVRGFADAFDVRPRAETGSLEALENARPYRGVGPGGRRRGEGTKRPG